MKSFAPRQITAAEYEQLTAKPAVATPAQISQAQMQAAHARHEKLQQFKANVAAALAAPEVTNFKQFLSTLDHEAKLGLLQELIDNDN